MPAREARDDEAQSLPVLDLDAPELGIRPEDQYAAIPPGPRLIPRRHHEQSSSAPILLLGGLVVFFVVGALLGGAGSDEDDEGAGQRAAISPVLEQPTGTDLLLFGDGHVTTLDVDRARVTRVGDVAARAVLVPSAVPGRVWLTSPGSGGSTTVRELDLADGTETSAPVPVNGRVVGALREGVVVERAPGALELVNVESATARTLGDQQTIVAAAGDTLATRTAECSQPDCEITVADLTTGTSRQLRLEVGGAGDELAALSPDGRRLAVLRSDGVETHGALIDLRLETITRFESRAAQLAGTGAPTLAWSSDGNWLFVATVRNGIDAISADGEAYRISADLPLFEGIVTG